MTKDVTISFPHKALTPLAATSPNHQSLALLHDEIKDPQQETEAQKRIRLNRNNENSRRRRNENENNIIHQHKQNAIHQQQHRAQ
jgi:hypothetical protein